MKAINSNDGITLVLSEQEARALMQVVGHIGGAGYDKPTEIYKLCGDIYYAICEVFPHKDTGYEHKNSLGNIEDIEPACNVVITKSQ